MAVEGLTTLESNHAPKETIDRLEAQLKARGMTVSQGSIMRPQPMPDCRYLRPKS
jgi:hypothetical protein